MNRLIIGKSSKHLPGIGEINAISLLKHQPHCTTISNEIEFIENRTFVPIRQFRIIQYWLLPAAYRLLPSFKAFQSIRANVMSCFAITTKVFGIISANEPKKLFLAKMRRNLVFSAHLVYSLIFLWNVIFGISQANANSKSLLEFGMTLTCPQIATPTSLAGNA